MYRQFMQVMFLDAYGWKALRDDAGDKVELFSLPAARQVAGCLARQEGVVDVMVVRVEQSQVFDLVTRQSMIHTAYTGMTL